MSDLDIRDELQELPDGDVRRLGEDISALLGRQGLPRGEVRPADSFSIRAERDRARVRELLERSRGLPPGRRPSLYNGLGQLLVGAGEFTAAWAAFQAAADTAAGPARAVALSNAYHAALEEARWDDALACLLAAVAIAPDRFAPCPLARYDIKRVLGAGGFGAALLCHDRHFGVDVVVKALHPDGLSREVDDVFREARLLLRLSHPGIIRILDCDYSGALQRPYLVMEYYDGIRLDHQVEARGTLGEGELVPLAIKVAEAMRAAHAEQVLHRDLKPGNVLVRQTEAGLEPRIIDFGLAVRRAAIEGRTVLADSLAGTLRYAPPEQMGLLPGTPAGPASDVFSFGKLCCFALFGAPEPRRRQWASISSALADLLEDCTEARPDRRVPTFDAVLERLGGLAQGKPKRKAGRQEKEVARSRQEQFLAAFQANRWGRLLPAGKASARQLEAAVVALRVPGDEYIFALHDTSPQRDGSAGVVFGRRGIYFLGTNPDEGAGSGMLPYSSLARVGPGPAVQKRAVQLGEWQVLVPGANCQKKLLALLNALAPLTADGWEPELPAVEKERREERERLAAEVSTALAAAREALAAYREASLGPLSAFLLLVGIVLFLSCGASSFFAGFPLWASWPYIFLRLGAVAAAVACVALSYWAIEWRQRQLDQSVNAEALARVKALEGQVGPALKRLEEIDSGPWHPYLTRLPAENRYSPPPGLGPRPPRAAWVGALLGGLALAVCCLLLWIGPYWGEPARGRQAYAEGGRLWKQGERAGAAERYREALQSELTVAGLEQRERSTALRRVLRAGFSPDEATAVALFLLGLPDGLLQEAVWALFSIGWDDGAVRQVVGRWAGGQPGVESMRRLTARATEAALGEGKPSLASQILNDGFEAWRTRKSKRGENEKEAGRIAALVLRPLLAGKSAVEARALARRFCPFIPEGERQELVSRVADLVREKEGEAAAGAFLKEVGMK